MVPHEGRTALPSSCAASQWDTPRSRPTREDSRIGNAAVAGSGKRELRNPRPTGPTLLASAFRSAPDPSDVAVFEEVRRAVKGSQSGTASAGDGMLVLDVRRPRERETPGRIPGTKNVPCKALNLSHHRRRF